MANHTDTVILGDSIDTMRGMDGAFVDLIFADPPFNIDKDYDLYRDKKPYEEYYSWSEAWIKECHRICKPDGAIYVAIGDEFAAELNILLKRAGFHFRNWITWHYRFGESQKRKFSRCHTHILYFTKSKFDFTFNRDDILVPSERQLKYNDKRAKAGGKTPEDVWPVYADAGGLKHELAVWPQDWEVWTDSRVCGTFRERIVKPDGSAHPCQMPLSVLRRVVKASSKPGELIADPFCGTGTTAVAAKALGRHYLMMELSPNYYEVTNERLKATQFGWME